MTQKNKITLELAALPNSVKAHIKRLEQVRRDFVANVSHELRTPLTVVRGYLETLIAKKDLDLNTLQEIFAQMYHHSVRMENIIEELLLLSRLQAEETEIILQTQIHIATVLETLCIEAKSISGDNHHQITLEANPKLVLDGSESELKSLFSNLLINAVKYTPAHGRIDVRWFYENGKAIFQVTDTGIGIAKKHIPRITERFYCVDKARSRSSGGTGLGLAIAKHVALRHQAELKIDSKLGKGSTFSCIFPKERVRLIS